VSRVLPLVLFAGCVRHEGELVTSVQVLASTMPVDPDGYQLGPWVAAEACDFIDTDLHVADLIYEAQGTWDAIVNVTVEHYERYVYVTQGNSGAIWRKPESIGAHCYRVQGQAVRLLRPPERAPTAP
jgi:hypothetical protein